MTKYKVEMKQFSDLENEVTVPRFQRRLVWTKKQKEEFIETLHNGYPFGSILVYKYDEGKGSDKKYTIIDGLQRYSTILEFKNSPEKYIKFDDYIDELTQLLIKSKESYSHSTLRKLSKSIEESIIEMFSLNKKDNSFYLYDSISNKAEELGIDIGNELLRDISNIQTQILAKVKNYLDTDRIKIPTIFFTGNESELAIVFENLNRGGKKLSKFQVFAAQWSDTNIQLINGKYSDKILEKVIDRYNLLNSSRDVEIKDFDEEIMRKNRTINLPEFCYAVGELILENMPVFWKSGREDLANTIGYSTIAIVLGVQVRELHKIIDRKEIFNNSRFLENIVEKIISEYQTINTHFSRFLIYPCNSKNRYEGSIATNFQLLSYFATLWKIKYEPISIFEISKLEKDDIFKNKHFKKIYEPTIKNLIFYYIDDGFSGYWSGTGDSKVDKIIENKNIRYSKSLSMDMLELTLINWWEERQQTPTIRFDGHSKTLLVIHSNLEGKIYNELDYDLEHVIPKNKVKDIYKKGEGIPAGSLGNMMFMEMGENRSKMDFNLYEVLKESSTLSKEFIDTRFYPSKEDFDKIESEINSNSYSFTYTREVINKRGKNIINNLLKKLYSM